MGLGMRVSRKITRADVMQALRGERMPGRLADGSGLYLVTRAGGNSQWVFLKMVQGKRSEIMLGNVRTMGAAGGTDLSKIATASLEAARQAAAAKQAELNAGASLEGLKKVPVVHRVVQHSSQSYTWQDVADVYVRSNTIDGVISAKREQEIKRIVASLERATPNMKNVMLFGYKQAEAWSKMRLAEISRSSVLRELNVIKPMLSMFITNMELQNDLKNPFTDFKLPKDKVGTSAINKRLPLELEEIKATRKQIQENCRDVEILQIWDMLTMTGARGAEIQGLRISDVHLNDTIPHVRVTPYDERGVKTEESIRWIPLYGIALEAAKAAYEKNKNTGYLFGKEGKQDYKNVSQKMLPQLRKVTKDPKKVPYSLRHSIVDLFREHGVSREISMPFVGHTSSDVAELVYGSPEKQLLRAHNAVATIMNNYSQSITESN